MTNQFLKYLYSKISKSTIENGERSNQSFERADRIIIWIVGFSIGIFVILFTKDYDIKNPNYKTITELSNQITIVSLIVVIFGLIFRIFSFFSQMLLTAINMDFAGYADGFSTTLEFPTPRKIKNSDTIEDIIYYFEQDFKIIQEKPDFSNSSQESIKEYRTLLINYYKSLADGNDIEVQIEEYKNKLCEYYGISKEKINERFDNNKNVKLRGKVYQKTLIGSYIFFFLTIATFIIGAIIILEKLVNKTQC
ncbi:MULTISPECIES: hypothetical protein [Flavobacterium]|uniref:SMODS and SLOG-associating 2TM effector domain-containing protein n=1 Tax=Flavobacterium helocola TaxID=3139139 RepID=A0ABU9I6Q6_9FLAO|nr:hypothetical protein [Flavobacterium sp. UBA7663]